MSELDEIIVQYEAPNRTPFINTRLRVHPKLHAMLEASASKCGRSFNSELCYRLAISLREHP